MALVLRHVPASSGVRWIRDAFRLYRRRPLALTLMLATFLFGVTICALLPWFIGVPLLLMSPPLLSLGFMIGSQSALLNDPVDPRQFIEGLRTDSRRRRALLLMCALYGAGWAGAAGIAYLVGGDTAVHLLAMLAGREPGASDPAQMGAVMSDPSISAAVTVFDLGMALLSIPFWHAPALVHWGGQGVGQALFSSTLALWRNKGAFAVYGLAWAGIGIPLAMVLRILLAVFGTGSLGLGFALALLMAVWTLFYVSVLFTFNDSFGNAPEREPKLLEPPA
jgi:hypothetical protein